MIDKVLTLNFMDSNLKVEYVYDKELTVTEVKHEMLTILSRASSEELEATGQANDVTEEL